MKLTLRYPLTLGKTTIEALTFRDYTTAADYLAFDTKGGVAQNIALVASLTGTDAALIQQLRGPDWIAAQREADRLLLADNDLPAIEDAAPEKKP
ncbi:MAG: phage tail assembly protein [Zoogloeaceae bacterium]|jgi:hypothetical protein|nr:phage tail assembly protein [Zoogloeaceae bacterium]